MMFLFHCISYQRHHQFSVCDTYADTQQHSLTALLLLLLLCIISLRQVYHFEAPFDCNCASSPRPPRSRTQHTMSSPHELPYSVGDLILVQHTDAKVLQLGDGSVDGEYESVFVHFVGWNKNKDSWSRLEHTRPITEESRAEQASMKEHYNRQLADRQKRRAHTHLASTNAVQGSQPCAERGYSRPSLSPARLSSPLCVVLSVRLAGQTQEERKDRASGRAGAEAAVERVSGRSRATRARGESGPRDADGDS